MAKTVDPMLEISAALADLVEAMSSRDERAAAALSAALREAMTEVSAPLAELLEGLDRIGAEGAQKIAAALQNIRSGGEIAQVDVKAPDVHVKVEPQVEIVMPVTPGWRFEEFEYHPNGALRGMTARRLEA